MEKDEKVKIFYREPIFSHTKLIFSYDLSHMNSDCVPPSCVRDLSENIILTCKNISFHFILPKVAFQNKLCH